MVEQVDRARGLRTDVGAVASPVGLLPRPVRWTPTVSTSTGTPWTRLFEVDADSWELEADLTEEFFATFGDRVPKALRDQLGRLRDALAR